MVGNGNVVSAPFSSAGGWGRQDRGGIVWSWASACLETKKGTQKIAGQQDAICLCSKITQAAGWTKHWPKPNITKEEVFFVFFLKINHMVWFFAFPIHYLASESFVTLICRTATLKCSNHMEDEYFRLIFFNLLSHVLHLLIFSRGSLNENVDKHGAALMQESVRELLVLWMV